QTQTIGTTHMNSLRRDDLNNRFPGLLETILSQRG
ncbi:TPA: transcriptional regulator, partial [Pseudomonas aeruginosa]